MNGKNLLLLIGTNVLVAALAITGTWAFLGKREEPVQPQPTQPQQQEQTEDRFTKLEQLAELIDEKYIDQEDYALMEDAAAAAFTAALPDEWSYYVSASEYAAFAEDRANAYVGIGITIVQRSDDLGFDIILVEPESPAQKAGILPGDILCGAQGQDLKDVTIDQTRDLVRGEEGTSVSVQVLRDEQKLDFDLVRQTIQIQVAAGRMLEGNVGYVKIANFHTGCADMTKAITQQLLDQGATGIIYDVRNNSGGFKTELVALLDYLLPEGPLFRSLDYNNNEVVDYSQEDCLQVPMVVMVNGDSYSAAEFFAAALEEYDWATVVGSPTTGKGYFQNTYNLEDGSALVLSVGKYFTPEGVSLAETGGLVPQIQVDVDAQTAAMIYAGLLEPQEDPQLVAAVEALTQP